MGKEGPLEGDNFFLKCLHLFNRYCIEHLSYLLYVNVSSKFGVCRDSVPSETMNKCIGELVCISLILVHKSDAFYFQNCDHLVIKREI